MTITDILIGLIAYAVCTGYVVGLFALGNAIGKYIADEIYK
jgi:hypothetical protein